MVVHRFDFAFREPDDGPQIQLLLFIAEREGYARRPGPARPADSVHVGFGNIRHVIVDDMGDIIHIDAARGNVRGDQDAGFSRLEIVQCDLPRHLRFVAMDGFHVHVLAVQFAVDPFGAVLGTAKDKHGLQLRVFQEPDKQMPFVDAGKVEHILVNRVDRGGDRRDGNLFGIFKHGIDQVQDFMGHGGREKHGLAHFGHQADDALHIGCETHVQHAVRLVEDEDPDMVEVDVSLSDKVQQTTRRCHQDVHSFFQGGRLVGLGNAAKDNGYGQIQESAVCQEAFFYLQRQFARRRQDQRADGGYRFS